MAEPIHLRARRGVEAVLAGRPAGERIAMREFLCACGGIHWRSIQGALRRLEAEGRVHVHGGRRIEAVTVREPFEPLP